MCVCACLLPMNQLFILICRFFPVIFSDCLLLSVSSSRFKSLCERCINIVVWICVCVCARDKRAYKAYDFGFESLIIIRVMIQTESVTSVTKRWFGRHFQIYCTYKLAKQETLHHSWPPYLKQTINGNNTLAMNPLKLKNKSLQLIPKRNDCNEYVSRLDRHYGEWFTQWHGDATSWHF